MLPQCELLALLDVDVTMVDWTVPLADLLLKWNFTGGCDCFFVGSKPSPT
jgi:hypothetical protein